MVVPIILIHFIFLPLFLFFLVALTIADRTDILSRKIANLKPKYSQQSNRRARTATVLSYYFSITWGPGFRSRYRVWLLAGRSGFQMPVEVKDFSLLQNLSTVSGTNQASYSRSNRVKANGT
jgi:hypothetical protein